MNSEALFTVTTNVTLCGWLLLAIGMFVRVSHWRDKLLMTGGRIVPLTVAIAYAALLARVWGAPRSGEGLQQIVNLYGTADIVLLVWIHFLVVDLFIGRWIVDDATSHGIRPVWLVPLLYVTLMYGPVGLLAYFVLRRVMFRRQPL